MSKNMDKLTARNIFIQERKKLTDEEVFDKSHKIKNLCIKHILFHLCKTVHIFLPIQKMKEVNTWVLIHHLWDMNIHTATGVMLPNSLDMENILFQKNTEIKVNKWGIPEPISKEISLKKDFDIIFLPLVCFDMSGNRIGYGKGIYDRWLADIPPSIPKIGLSLLSPVEDLLNNHSQDVRLDFCITPKQMYTFHKKKHPLIVL